MTLPSLLLFDLGGVLVENAGFERLNQMLGDAIDVGQLKDKWLASPTVRRFELGLVSPDEFASGFVAEWGLACTGQTFLSEFACWPKGFYAGARELLARLRQSHRVGCLSNSNPLHWERFGGFEGDFDVALSSHLLGAIKPDRECFNRAFLKCGVEAEDVVFFDDSLTNVLAARALGVRAFHVDGFREVVHVLENEGLVR